MNDVAGHARYGRSLAPLQAGDSRLGRAATERLEDRILMSAADAAVAAASAATPDQAVRVNFQPAGTGAAGDYLLDFGATYGERDDLTYGWTADHTDSVFDREVNGDQLVDGHVAVKAASRWEMAVENGPYTVEVGVGDAAAASRNNIWIEGVRLYDYVPQAANTFSSRTITVEVKNRKLTMGVGSAADFETRINYIEVRPADETSVPPAAVPPAAPPAVVPPAAVPPAVVPPAAPPAVVPPAVAPPAVIPPTVIPPAVVRPAAPPVVAPVAPPAADGQRIRIMPLGDSITAGTNGAYRTQLYLLLSYKYSDSVIDFVGTSTNAGSPALPDRNHEGHGGYRIEDISRNLDGNNGRSGNNGGYWLTGTSTRAPIMPTFILLHIGTNDIPYLPVAQMGNQLDALVDKITTLRPNARLMLANLIVRNDAAEAKSQNYNAMVPDIARKYAAMGRKVTFVDLHGKLSPSDLYDGLHPNAAGERKLAAAWNAAVQAAIAGR